MDISIDIVELPHKGVKLYCKDNGKPLPQRSWSTLACLDNRNLGDYWQDNSEMGTEEVISNSSSIDTIEVDRDDRERIPTHRRGRRQGQSVFLNRMPPSIPIRPNQTRIKSKMSRFQARMRTNLQESRLN